MTVRSEILIDAPPAHVFSILVDFDAYPEWNRFTPRITLRTGGVVVGTEFDLDCRMTESELLVDEHEVVLSYEPDRFRFSIGTSRTKGRPGIRSERVQVCEPAGEGRTRLVNEESYAGFLAPIVRLLYDGKLGRAFEAYAATVKARAEGSYRAA